MCVAWEHVDDLDMVAIHFPLKHFAFRVVEVALLDKSVTLDDDELLPLGVMPVLTLGDAGLGDIDGYLSTIECMNQFCK